MANVYSQLLWRATCKNSSGTITSPSVPTGFVWVVRSIVLGIPEFSAYATLGITIGDSQGGLIAGIWPPESIGNRYWHQEMHQVLNAGDHLTAISHDLVNWYIRVSGYALTLP